MLKNKVLGTFNGFDLGRPVHIFMQIRLKIDARDNPSLHINAKHAISVRSDLKIGDFLGQHYIG